MLEHGRICPSIAIPTWEGEMDGVYVLMDSGQTRPDL